MLLTDRRQGFGMHDEDNERDGLQGSLFAPESLATPSRHARPPGPTPDPFAPALPDAPPAPDVTDAPSDLVPDSDDGLDVPSGVVPTADDVVEATPGGFVPFKDDGLDATPSGLVPTGDDGLDAPVDLRAPDDIDAGGLSEFAPPTAAPSPRDVAPRRAAAPLTGPTLDDVISRVWEGMRGEAPAPCPVCRAEVDPSMGGRCGSCGSAID